MKNNKNRSLKDKSLNKAAGGYIDPFFDEEGLQSYAAKDNQTGETIATSHDPNAVKIADDYYHKGKLAGAQDSFLKGYGMGLQDGAKQALNNLHNH